MSRRFTNRRVNTKHVSTLGADETLHYILHDIVSTCKKDATKKFDEKRDVDYMVWGCATGNDDT
jgi:hypothetical protein